MQYFNRFLQLAPARGFLLSRLCYPIFARMDRFNSDPFFGVGVYFEEFKGVSGWVP